MIYVTLQHPSPYYDDSYGVNSANNGPYGDAILQELIPAIETRFRVMRAAVGADAVRRIDRRLDRGRAPGLLPGLLRRRVRSCPDAVDFRYHQIVNIYEDANAYFVDKRLDARRSSESAAGRRQHPVDDERREPLRAGGRRQVALGRPVGHLGSRPTRRSAPTATRSVSGTRRPGRSTRPWPRPGGSTTSGTCSRPTGRRSARRSDTS